MRTKNIKARSLQLLSQVSQLCWACGGFLACAAPLAASSWGTSEKSSARAFLPSKLQVKLPSQVRAGLSIPSGIASWLMFAVEVSALGLLSALGNSKWL